jgi:hypothetical protein
MHFRKRTHVSITLLIFAGLAGAVGCGSPPQESAPPSPYANCHGTCIQLNWNACTGSPPITGYTIYYGQTSGGPYPQKISVGNATSYLLTNVAPGTYDFVATCSASTAESGYSSEVQAVVTAGMQNRIVYAKMN